MADTVAPVSEPPPGCQGTMTPSADNCTLELDLVCVEPLGSSGKQIGTIHWAVDGSSGNGVVTRTVFGVDQTVKCISTYDLTCTKA